MISLGKILALIGFAFIGIVFFSVNVISSGSGILAVLLFVGLFFITYGMLENAEIPESPSQQTKSNMEKTDEEVKNR